MRITEMIGKENGKTIEAALRRYIPMMDAGGKELEQLTEEEWNWIAAISDLLVWFNGTDYERLMYFRYVQKRNDKEIAVALSVDRSTVFKLLRDVQICAAFRAIARGLIVIPPL